MPQNSKTTGQGANPYQRALEELCCVNPLCPDNGARSHGNLSIRTGKGGGCWRVLRCGTCKAEFSERKGTAMWGTTMPPDKAESIAKHLKEGCGIRKTGRLVGVSKDSVTRMALRLGRHAQAQHNKRARGLKVREAQADEKWAFVGKKTETL